MFHEVPTIPKLTLLLKLVPFMSQITRSPVTLFCQRMSGLPSALKSPDPTMFHEVPTTPKLTLLLRLVPFMSQITRSPVTLFCQRISDFPSPLKSAFGGKIPWGLLSPVANVVFVPSTA